MCTVRLQHTASVGRNELCYRVYGTIVLPCRLNGQPTHTIPKNDKISKPGVSEKLLHDNWTNSGMNGNGRADDVGTLKPTNYTKTGGRLLGCRTSQHP